MWASLNFACQVQGLGLQVARFLPSTEVFKLGVAFPVQCSSTNEPKNGGFGPHLAEVVCKILMSTKL